MAFPPQQEYCFAGDQGARLESYDKVDLSKVGGKMLILGCTAVPVAIGQVPSTFKLVNRYQH